MSGEAAACCCGSVSIDKLECLRTEPGSIGVSRLFIASRWIELLLFLEFIKQQPVNSHCVALSHAAAPNARESSVQRLHRAAPHHLVDKRDVLARGEDKGELFVGGGEDVVHGVPRAVDHLNILHAL
jgi:hypothetical protein